MTIEEKEKLLEALHIARRIAFEGSSPIISSINVIRDRLLTLSSADRPFYKDFVEELKNQLFAEGVSLTGLDLNLFTPSEVTTESPEASEVVEELKVSVPIEKSKQTYKEVFLGLVKSIEYELKTLKGYFFIHLKSSDDFETKVILLHDNVCFYQPAQKKLSGELGGTCLYIEDFKKQIESGAHAGVNYVAMVLLSTKVNEKPAVDAMLKSLQEIIESYPEFDCMCLKTCQGPKVSDILTNNDFSALLDEIRYVTSTYLTNAELSNDEEKIIKKLFHSASSILEYKVLKGGKSGSKVLEIRPKLIYSGETAKRFVVKFGPLDSKKKIQLESTAFATNVENFAIDNYHAKQYEYNSTVEGMKYVYASKDAVKDSYSYSKILSDPDNIYHQDSKRIIEELFSNEPFQTWNQSKESIETKVGDLYQNYVNPDKIFKFIQLIKGLSDSELLDDPLYKSFNLIFNYDLSTLIKVCHGDLHSENFFKDENGIYLIDFGFTASTHALVDHTALECSIKFKHVPNYIEIQTLMEIEDQLLTEESFNATFQLQTSRKDILGHFEIINAIRRDSIQHSKESSLRLEYLISLFIMTCRQIQYDDLNQLYALRSAEAIGNRIIQLLE